MRGKEVKDIINEEGSQSITVSFQLNSSQMGTYYELYVIISASGSSNGTAKPVTFYSCILLLLYVYVLVLVFV